VSPLGVIPDGVASPHPDPLGDGPVLLALLGELLFDPEGLQGRHGGLPLLLKTTCNHVYTPGCLNIFALPHYWAVHSIPPQIIYICTLHSYKSMKLKGGLSKLY